MRRYLRLRQKRLHLSLLRIEERLGREYNYKMSGRPDFHAPFGSFALQRSQDMDYHALTFLFWSSRHACNASCPTKYTPVEPTNPAQQAMVMIGIQLLPEKMLLTPNADRMQLPMCRALSSTAIIIQAQLQMKEDYYLGNYRIQRSRTRSSDLTTLGKHGRHAQTLLLELSWANTIPLQEAESIRIVGSLLYMLYYTKKFQLDQLAPHSPVLPR
jgi:hypothetical protein